VRLLKKYSGLVFYDPDTKKTFSVLEKNMEFHPGKNKGWSLLGVCVKPGAEDEVVPFLLEIASKLIGQTKQNDVVIVHHKAPCKYDNKRPSRANHKITEDNITKRARATHRSGTLRTAKNGSDGNGAGDAKEEEDEDDINAVISPSLRGSGYGANDYYEVDEILDRRVLSRCSESAGQVVEYCKCS